ncbi:MAG TPA: DUF1592 domain-containing protein [Gammaproteobacteria bacterium]
MRRRFRLVTGLALVTAAGFWAAHRAGFFQDDGAVTRAAVAGYCIDCHDPVTRSGDLVLDPALFDQVGDRAEVWEKVVRKVAAREMPPADSGGPRPDEATYEAMRRYLESALDAHAAAHPNAGDLPLLHRLTRTQYRNAVRDLLALGNLPAELDFELLLPADNASSGFDNIAELLFVSPRILERYFDAARKISRLAVGDTSAPVLVNLHRTPLQYPQDRHVEGLPIGTRGGLLIETYFPLDAEYAVRVEVGGRGDEPHELEILIDGQRAAAATIAPSGPGVPRRPEPLEFRIPAAAGPAKVGVTFVERSQAFDESTLRVRRRSRGTLPYVERVTVSGPFNAAGPGDTPSRARIFVCRPETAEAELPCARRILGTLARRAYRRPVDEADLADLLPFFETGRAEGGFERGIQLALERLLVSPQFLYRVEVEPPGVTPGEAFPVSDLELATRLSFFLWSSIPDDELLDLAEAGRLGEPAVLEAQVERMLADPRAESLVTDFAVQWLFLHDLEAKDPDLFLFRDYDETLREAFRREIELFVGSIFRENRSVLDLLSADYTFVNQRLAEHYGIPNVRGSRFRRVTLPEGSPRAGLLGKGGILALTSYPTRTSPVLRGKYVLENLLASPPPPPPPNVPSLVTEDASAGKALTMREALARHRADPACAACHARMDAIGFALENFDAVGRWRDTDAGQPIDASSTLPDGTPIDGLAGLEQFLTRDPERFAAAFTEKLLMFAIGRNVQYYDAPAVRRIVREAARDDYAFASIVKGIVKSVPFRMRNARAGERVAAAADMEGRR